jgi:hypothetical protein
VFAVDTCSTDWPDGPAHLAYEGSKQYVQVPLCPALLSEFNGMKFAYAHTITRQYMLARGGFIIENPDKAADAKAANLAAVDDAEFAGSDEMFGVRCGTEAAPFLLRQTRFVPQAAPVSSLSKVAPH